jgi:hypothetical protein
MREDLLGYLLGALEPDEEREVEDRLEADPELRQRLRVIRRGLEPLSSDDGLIDAPPGLAARACNFIDQPRVFESLGFDGIPAGDESSHSAAGENRVAGKVSEAAAAITPSSAPSAAAGSSEFPGSSGGDTVSDPEYAANPADTVVRPASPAGGAFSPSTRFESAPAVRRWGMADVLVTAGVVAAASMLVIPALSAGRYQAQVTACRERLHRLGTALVDYSRVRGGVFPEVEEDGPLSRAGVYAARLREARLINDYADVTCPASGHGYADGLSENPLEESEESRRIPELAKLAVADDAEVDSQLARRTGTYGYALGYVDDDGYHVRRNHNRSTFIVLSDMPHDGKSGSRHHGCGGQNVWFEDGHVEFLNTCRLSHLGDQIFENRRGFVGAGLGPDDIVIGRNTDRPLISPVGFAQ